MNAYGNYPDLTGAKRILVIKLRNHGDVLLTSPVFSVLRQKLPNAKIDAYIYKDSLPMLDGHPAINDFLLYNRDWKFFPFSLRVFKEMEMLLKIRRQKYDLVLNLTDGDRGAFASLLSGAEFRIGLDPEGEGFRYKKGLYTHIVRRCRKPRHMAEQNLDALRRIGIFPSEEERDLLFYVPDDSRTRINNVLLSAGIKEHAYVLLHPTSRWFFKCWDIGKMAGLIRRLDSEGYKVVISSGPAESELSMVSQIMALCQGTPALSLAGKLSLKELGALIHGSLCTVGVDSVPMHMASALKVPAVVLFGPSSEEAWGPWNNDRGLVISRNISCRPCNLDGCGGGKVSDCLQSLTVDEVFFGIKSALGKIKTA